ncbi:MAG: radical protein, partial [Myxococcaceae bacterium]|nr:radical protein [Myxococcaceae bacterium]
MFLPPRFPTALARGARMLLEPTAPVLVQMVVTRRCNLACGYCNEYDDFSDPLPYEQLTRQIDHIAALGTVVLTFTGGEPLLQPRLDDLIAYAVGKGIVVTSITNGYPITRKWIERLNAARLSFLQISIDNLEPNEVSQKSLSKIWKKLELLKEHAKFGVNVNAVLGSSPP